MPPLAAIAVGSGRGGSFGTCLGRCGGDLRDNAGRGRDRGLACWRALVAIAASATMLAPGFALAAALLMLLALTPWPPDFDELCLGSSINRRLGRYQEVTGYGGIFGCFNRRNNLGNRSLG